MDPTTPPTPVSDATQGYTLLMSSLGYLRQKAEAYDKRPLPATEDQVKDLVKLAERDRPLEVKVETEEVVKQLVGKVEQLTAAYLAKSDKLIELVDDRTDYLTEQLKAGVEAVQLATAEMKAVVKVIPGSVPVTGKFYGFTNWQAAVVTVVVSALLGALLLSALSSKVSKEDFERLQAKERQAVRTNAVVTAEGRYYIDQIKRYKGKNPNKTTDFPAYKPAE